MYSNILFIAVYLFLKLFDFLKCKSLIMLMSGRHFQSRGVCRRANYFAWVFRCCLFFVKAWPELCSVHLIDFPNNL